MKFVVVFMMFFSFLFAGDFPSHEICYKFDKKHFSSNLDEPYDVRIDVSFLNYSDIKHKNMMFDLMTKKKIKYLTGNFLYCTQKEEDTNSYHCSGDDDSGQVNFDIKGENIYLHVGHVTLAQTPDDPIIYQVHSKDEKSVRGEKISCKD